MNSRVRIIHRLLGGFLVFLSLCFIAFGILILFFTDNISLMSIFAGVFFLWIGTGYVLLTLNNMKTIKLEERYLIIGTWFGLLEKKYTFEDIYSICPKSFRNNWKTYPGLIIKFRSGRQVHIHEMEFINFRELKKAIKSRVDNYEKLELDIWNKFMKIHSIIGVIILISIFLAKVIEN